MRKITTEQSKDTGLAMTLILLILGLSSGLVLYFKIAIGALVLVMTFPGVFRPLGVVWFGFSHILGTVMSQVILTLVYVIFVVPMSLLLKIFGKDSLRLKEFKKSSDSILIVRNHRFQPGDFEKPY